MSAQPDSVTTLEAIEALDFKAELPCEHHLHPVRSWHSGHGNHLVRRFPHCAGSPGLMLICQGAWEHAATFGLHCRNCGQHLSRDEGWQLLEVLS